MNETWTFSPPPLSVSAFDPDIGVCFDSPVEDVHDDVDVDQDYHDDVDVAVVVDQDCSDHDDDEPLLQDCCYCPWSVPVLVSPK